MNKNEKLQDAIGMIGDDLIADAKGLTQRDSGKNDKGLDSKDKYTRNNKKKYSRVLKGLAAVAALALAITAAVYLSGENTGILPGEKSTGGENSGVADNNDMKVPNRIDTADDNEVLNAYAVAKSEYPVMAPYPDESKALEEGSYEQFDKAYELWKADRNTQLEKYRSMSISINSFVKASVQEFLGDAADDNIVYSPLNVYMALGMLAELTDGNSRQQILDVVGADSIESLRREANAIWNAHYCNDGAVTSLLASSVWLNKDIDFKQQTLNRLASDYYAASYQGEMGTDEFNEALHQWINDNTGGLLSEQAEALNMTPDTVLALATTVFYSANWSDKFSEEKTDIQTFHGTAGDVQCEFMNARRNTNYYWGDKFSAVMNGLEESGYMYIILPDEGVSVGELLADDQWLDFVYAGYKWDNSKSINVNMSIPKFDVSSQLELTEGLKNLGVTDVFDAEVADFSQLTDMSGIEVSEAKHGVRVAIDEEGCTAAAFTAILKNGSAMPPEDEIDFVVDRPFIFVVTSEVGLPMFVGVVNMVK